MNLVSRTKLCLTRTFMLSREFSGTSALDTQQWRIGKGLSANRNAESVLTDGPDYTFLDGRPTPLLHKQKLRMLKQREYASQIIQLSSELDFAKDRHQKIQKEKEDERQKIISNRLKVKGDVMQRRK